MSRLFRLSYLLTLLAVLLPFAHASLQIASGGTWTAVRTRNLSFSELQIPNPSLNSVKLGLRPRISEKGAI